MKKFLVILFMCLPIISFVGCKKCSEVICEHKDTYHRVVQGPTCYESGLESIVCKSCGDILEHYYTSYRHHATLRRYDSTTHMFQITCNYCSYVRQEDLLPLSCNIFVNMQSDGNFNGGNISINVSGGSEIYQVVVIQKFLDGTELAVLNEVSERLMFQPWVPFIAGDVFEIKVFDCNTMESFFYFVDTTNFVFTLINS